MHPRTYLFVPGNRPERFRKALASGADAVVLDLEDAVPQERKIQAREAIAEFILETNPEERESLVVRINDASTTWFDGDVDLLRRIDLPTVMLPKAERTQVIGLLRETLPNLRVVALIETARGVINAEAIAATAGVVRLVFGTIDYALDLGLSGDPVGFDMPASKLALASRAAGLPAPVAGVTTEINDDVLLLDEFARARAHGFGAKLCIHPRQVGMVHEALRPSEAEIVWARRVVAASESGGAACAIDGQMVDRPVVERAKLLLSRTH